MAFAAAFSGWDLSPCLNLLILSVDRVSHLCDVRTLHRVGDFLCNCNGILGCCPYRFHGGTSRFRRRFYRFRNRSRGSFLGRGFTRVCLNLLILCC